MNKKRLTLLGPFVKPMFIIGFYDFIQLWMKPPDSLSCVKIFVCSLPKKEKVKDGVTDDPFLLLSNYLNRDLRTESE